MSRTSNGRGWAYIGTTLGGAVSLAANAAHSYVAPAGAPASWHPHPGAVGFAVFWPIALFVAIEMLARVRWREGALWVAVRYLGLVPVAVVAAIVSYQHLSGLLATYGENRLTIVIGPLAVDGLMVLSAAAVMATSPRHLETAPEPVLPVVPERAPEQPQERTPEPDPEPRPKTPRKRARKATPAKRTDEELLALARPLHEAALAATGEPVSKRSLRAALKVGQPTVDRIHAALAVGSDVTPDIPPQGAPEAAPEYVLAHANGSTV